MNRGYEIAGAIVGVLVVAGLIYVSCDTPPLGNDAPAVVSPKPIILTHFETQHIVRNSVRAPYNMTHIYNIGQHSRREYYMDNLYVWADPNCAWYDSAGVDSTGPRVKVKDPPEPPTQKDGE